jgi:hypothetical protein
MNLMNFTKRTGERQELTPIRMAVGATICKAVFIDIQKHRDLYEQHQQPVRHGYPKTGGRKVHPGIS